MKLTLINELVRGCACKYVCAYVHIKIHYKYYKPADIHETFTRKAFNFLYICMNVREVIDIRLCVCA